MKCADNIFVVDVINWKVLEGKCFEKLFPYSGCSYVQHNSAMSLLTHICTSFFLSTFVYCQCTLASYACDIFYVTICLEILTNRTKIYQRIQSLSIEENFVYHVSNECYNMFGSIYNHYLLRRTLCIMCLTNVTTCLGVFTINIY